MAARGLGEWTRGDHGSVALEQRLQGYTPVIPPGPPAMAHFHPTFIGSSYFNRIARKGRHYM